MFSNFNILLYAENHIYPAASAEGVEDINREELYDLYYMARQLEPEPRKKELTFTQRTLVNKARQFITMRQRKRTANKLLKKGKKDKIKLGKVLSD